VSLSTRSGKRTGPSKEVIGKNSASRWLMPSSWDSPRPPSDSSTCTESGSSARVVEYLNEGWRWRPQGLGRLEQTTGCTPRSGSWCRWPCAIILCPDTLASGDQTHNTGRRVMPEPWTPFGLGVVYFPRTPRCEVPHFGKGQASLLGRVTTTHQCCGQTEEEFSLLAVVSRGPDLRCCPSLGVSAIQALRSLIYV